MAPTEHTARRFRPSLAATITLAALATAFAGLGAWQVERATFKQGLQDRFADRSSPPSTTLPETPRALDRVRIEGRYDNQHQVLIDNRVYQGRPGVHALSPFLVDNAHLTLLVNRGWLPMPADRSTLPAAPAVTGTVSVSGHLDLVRQPGITLGEADRLDGDRWPQLVTYPELPALEQALGTPLYPMVLYLAPGEAGALEGLDWDPFPMPAARHRGYALTWFSLLLCCGVAWVMLGVQRGRKLPT